VALAPISQDTNLGTYLQHQLARIYILVGEPEQALDQLESLLNTPNYRSPGWLKIDPNFDPLRSNPRFQKLVTRDGLGSGEGRPQYAPAGPIRVTAVTPSAVAKNAERPAAAGSPRYTTAFLAITSR
jgi:hypothetical protein